MKKFLFYLAIPLMLHCSKSDDNITGTVTDVNSGSILGMIKNDGNQYHDSVTVSLFSGDTIVGKRNADSTTAIKSIEAVDGSFRFDSLAAGTYSIRISKDSLILADTLGIVIQQGQTVNIEIKGWVRNKMVFFT